MEFHVALWLFNIAMEYVIDDLCFDDLPIQIVFGRRIYVGFAWVLPWFTIVWFYDIPRLQSTNLNPCDFGEGNPKVKPASFDQWRSYNHKCIPIVWLYHESCSIWILISQHLLRENLGIIYIYIFYNSIIIYIYGVKPLVSYKNKTLIYHDLSHIHKCIALVAPVVRLSTCLPAHWMIFGVSPWIGKPRKSPYRNLEMSSARRLENHIIIKWSYDSDT